MKNKFVVVSYNEKKESPEMRVARNYLVIPMTRRVYLVETKALDRDSVCAICDEIVATEQDNYTVYVMLERTNPICDPIRERYGESSTVQPVIIGRKTEMYLRAADVVLTKASLLTVPKTEKKPSVIRSKLTQVGGNIKEIIAEAKSRLDLRRPASDKR